MSEDKEESTAYKSKRSQYFMESKYLIHKKMNVRR